TTQSAMRDLILKGIPDRGMPAFPIPAAEADAIAAYVLRFKPAATTATASTPGDPAAGERYFTAPCATCHMARRPRGVLGPDPAAKSTLATGPLGPGVPFSDVARPKPGAWPTYDGALSGNRFSSLDQINTKTIDRLAPKWMFPLPGTPRSLEVTPVVVDGVM